MVDGYSQLKLDAYQMTSQTIDLAAEVYQIDILPPVFTDGDVNGIELPDPASPIRSISFKIKGSEHADLADYFIATVLDNSDPTKV